MALSKTKLAQELTPEELEAFCQKLVGVPHGEMAARIRELAAEQGISIGRTAAYEFKSKEAEPWLEQLKRRREKAAAIVEMGSDESGQTLADAAAAQLGQIAFDMVTELDGRLDMSTKAGRETFDQITKGIHRLRSGDRAMIAQLQRQLKDAQEKVEKTKEDLGNKALTEEEKHARMRARFGIV